jgi:hypothetical protein
MPAIEIRPLDLDREPDPALALLNHLVECRHVGPEVGPVLPAWVMHDDQLAVPARLDVELDVVRAQLDCTAEGRERVLGDLPAGSAVREDEHQER